MIVTKRQLADKLNELNIDPNDLVEVVEGILRMISLDYFDALEDLHDLIEELNSKEFKNGIL